MKKYVTLGKGNKSGRSFLVSRDNYAPSWKWNYINLTYLEKVAPKNLTLFVNLIRVFRGESVESLAKIKLHYRNEDFPAIEKAAHAMKPSGTYIGVNALTLLVSSLEQSAKTCNRFDIEVLIKEIETLLQDVNEEIEEYLKAA